MFDGRLVMRTYGVSNLENQNVFISKSIHATDEEIHLHEYVEVVFIENGKEIYADGFELMMVHSIDGKDYSVSRGDLIIINYNQTHSFKVDSEMTLYNIFLKSSFLDHSDSDNNNITNIVLLTAFDELRCGLMSDLSYIHFSSNALREAEYLIKSMVQEQQNKKEGYQKMMEMYAAMLFVQIFRLLIDNLESENNVSVSIDEITRYIEENCTEKLDLRELARKCFYNPSYFSRAFKKKNGITLIEFIHTHRIKKACELLKTTDFTVELIAEMCGYHDKSGFYQQFKKIIGCLPVEYKNT